MSSNKYLADEYEVKFAKFLRDNYKEELITNNVKGICRELFWDELPLSSDLSKSLLDVFPNASPFLISMDLSVFIQYFFQKFDFDIKWSWLADSKKLLFLAQHFIDYSGDLNLDNNIDPVPGVWVSLREINGLKQINFPSNFECQILQIECCHNLTTISLPGSNRLNVSFCNKLKEIRFTNGIVYSDYLYIIIQSCPSLNKLTLTRDTEVLPTGFIYKCHNLKEITYEGTKEEWNKVRLENKWCDHSIKIICTDGEIEIDI